MKERPILFSAPMVRAVLEGRKTQTRRVVKLNDAGRVKHSGLQWHPEDPQVWRGSPYGVPGDRLWVRETHSFDRLDVDHDGTLPPWYWADGNPKSGDWSRPRPSIHMPRWASRITLEITGVRVERLQDISEADAKAEGIFEWTSDQTGAKHYGIGLPDVWEQDPRLTYKRLWGDINGPESWAANPWVWVVEFKRLAEVAKAAA